MRVGNVKTAAMLDGYTVSEASEELGIDLEALQKKVTRVNKQRLISPSVRDSLLSEITLALNRAEVLGFPEIQRLLSKWKKIVESRTVGTPIRKHDYVRLVAERGKAREVFANKLRKRYGSVASFFYLTGKPIPEDCLDSEVVDRFGNYELRRVSEDRFILVGPGVKTSRGIPYNLGKRLLGEWIVSRDSRTAKRGRENTSGDQRGDN